MDPVTHTLTGLALARSGLARRTALGTLVLVAGANLPDLDALAYFAGPGADLHWRRGWTHGVPALVVLPFLLTGAVLLLDRLLHRLRRAALPSAVRPGQVLFLSALSVLTHPVLDTLNTYGVRWLMPFDGTWYYGDALFIVDPWVLLVLGIGLLVARRRRRLREFNLDLERPARLALAAALGYAALMAASGMAARSLVRRELDGAGGSPRPVERLMVGPMPATPFRRQVVAVQGDEYRTGDFRWLGSPHLDPATVRTWPRPGAADPALAAARRHETGRRFLAWARFPVAAIDSAAAGGPVVRVVDLRYASPDEVDPRREGFAAITLPLAP